MLVLVVPDILKTCRIETVGEERARHMSESAAGPSHWTAGRRKRAATLGSEVRLTLVSLVVWDKITKYF